MQKYVHHIATGYIAVLMLLKMLAVPVICLQFAMNRDYIINNLCENRDKPSVHCNGKCLLNKHLAKAHDANDSQNQKGASATVFIDYVTDVPSYSLTRPAILTQSFYSSQSTAYTAGYPDNIFHPPLQHC
ncbi:MAG: hypothetical protein QM731_03900 [Chitinophagaceae bacterium]